MPSTRSTRIQTHAACLLAGLLLSLPVVPNTVLAQADETGVDLKALVGEFKTATDAAGRGEVAGKLLAEGEAGAKLLGRELEKEMAAIGGEYARSFGNAIRSAYFSKLEALTDEQVQHILRTRFLWEPYILNGGSHPKFREVYLAPIWEMKEMLLPKVEEILDTDLQEMRAKLAEYAGYQSQCYEVVGFNPDPTAGKTSPTGIAYPPLDNPPNAMDRLHYYEQTLILVNTVASEGARPILLECDRAAREIDVEEADYVLAANEVRMLAGSIAWRVDPLGCAVARDHSNDRKLGLAKGHMSDVPGKRGFTHRNKRMGAPHYGSEGVGGGRNGRAYLNGLSYSGDGHGGPLYRLARNRVGVGCRDGAYTSQYGTDKKYIHPCPATEGVLWMPPGITPRDLSNGSTRRASALMKNGMWGSALNVLDKAESATGVDTVAGKFFRAAIDVKVNDTVSDILATEKSGDVYLAGVRLQQGVKQCNGIDAFTTAIEPVAERLQSEDLQSEMMAGQQYHRFCAPFKELEKERFNAARGQLVQQLRAIAESLTDSQYGKAAAHAAKRLADPESGADVLLEYFEQQREAQGVFGS